MGLSLTNYEQQNKYKIMEKKKELYLVSLATGNKFVVAIDKFYDVPIGEKKRMIVKELNEKLGAEIVQRVSFYGFAADVEVKDKFLKHKKQKL